MGTPERPLVAQHHVVGRRRRVRPARPGHLRGEPLPLPVRQRRPAAAARLRAVQLPPRAPDLPRHRILGERRTTLDSLATNYPNGHKLMVIPVITDGMVKVSGNEMTTPLTMMKEFVGLWCRIRMWRLRMGIRGITWCRCMRVTMCTTTRRWSGRSSSACRSCSLRSAANCSRRTTASRDIAGSGTARLC
ncbi:hypothetical protein C8R43DRAFT_440792 [Mycena crocata]|nr:hypothetical protein C8R43DRAFT_440792 [Mycena crocata]